MRTVRMKAAVRDIRKGFAMVLRITVSLVLWSLGSRIAIRQAAEPAREHRVVDTFVVDGA